jgi:hypothetical protein
MVLRPELAVGVPGETAACGLGDRAERIRVYEQVVQEGTEEEVRDLVDADRVLMLWYELVLPPSVRRAWARSFHVHRALHLGVRACIVLWDLWGCGHPQAEFGCTH